MRELVEEDTKFAQGFVELVLLRKWLLSEPMGASLLVGEVQLCHVVGAHLVILLETEAEFQRIYLSWSIWLFWLLTFGLVTSWN